MPSGFAYLDHPGPIAFAHRGGAAEAPENSWTSFTRAIDMGYRYMETDIRTTSDGVALAFHDPELARLLHRPGTLGRSTWAELGRALQDDGRPVPRLEELLDAWPTVRWNLDIKTAAGVQPVVAAVRRTGAQGRVLVTAFAGRRTAAARRLLGPGLATGAGRAAIAALVLAKRAPALARALRTRTAAAQVPMSSNGVDIVDEAFIEVCHGVGIAVHVWTIDDAPSINRLLDMGVDGIMTDRPTVLRSVLSGRGQWP